ncbi:MAG: response regulator [bacterium]
MSIRKRVYRPVVNKILIIDDNSIFCNAMKYHLLQKCYDVSICSSFSEFQDGIDVGEYDLILLDMRLRDATGIDFLKIIKKLYPTKKIIIVSSFLDDINITKALEFGVFTCLDKNSNLFNELDRIIDGI